MLCRGFCHGEEVMEVEGGGIVCEDKQGVHGVWCLTNENENPLSPRRPPPLSSFLSQHSALHALVERSY